MVPSSLTTAHPPSTVVTVAGLDGVEMSESLSQSSAAGGPAGVVVAVAVEEKGDGGGSRAGVAVRRRRRCWLQL